MADPACCQVGHTLPRIEEFPIEHVSQVEHHRWIAPAPTEHARGLTPLDGPTRALLHQLRWRKPPRDRRRLWVGLAIALLLHVMFVGITWWEMRPQPVREEVHARSGDALQVRLIPRQRVAQAPPLPEAPPPPPTPAAPRPAPVHEAPSKNAMTASLPASAASSTPPPRLFDLNGRPLLPNETPPPAPETSGYVQRAPQGDTRMMQHGSPVKYQATRFDKDWDKSKDIVDGALHKAVEKTTVKHTFHLAPGLRIHCAISFAALAGGCLGDPPSPPSAKDGDERLNMAPSASLAPMPSLPKPPSEAECIAIYRDGKPLPHGCPVDTPNRAVDAELRERESAGVAGK
ncbi:hypothetical protein [Dyella subtropica]|uniref:hypothetical protein n=1 Tax=Dyella subtropica TaxID=2992127 RepID=UPI00225B9F9F|nr:hypothetical protein [Dyella subtropica]